MLIFQGVNIQIRLPSEPLKNWSFFKITPTFGTFGTRPPEDKKVPSLKLTFSPLKIDTPEKEIPIGNHHF